MIEILSSILASDLLSVGSEVQRMLDNGVDSLHVDIMDAHFVPNLSFGPAMVSALKKAFVRSVKSFWAYRIFRMDVEENLFGRAGFC